MSDERVCLIRHFPRQIKPAAGRHAQLITEAPPLQSTVLPTQIKITNTDLFSISPGKGALKPNEKREISIRLNRLCNINAKLLISFAEVERLTADSIDQQLGRLDKEALSNIIIPITRTEHKEKEEKKEEKPFFKKTESPIYELDVEAEEEQSSKPKAGNTSTGLKKSLSINSSSNLYRSVEDLDRR